MLALKKQYYQYFSHVFTIVSVCTIFKAIKDSDDPSLVAAVEAGENYFKHSISSETLFFCTKGSFLAPERMALTLGHPVDATF